MGLSGYVTEVTEGLSPLWQKYIDVYNPFMWNKGDSYHSAPFWQVGAYDFHSTDGKTKAIIGAEYKGKKPDGIDVTIETIPAATWAVFPINSVTGAEKYNEAYTRILTEWFPASQYKRNEDVRNLDAYPAVRWTKNTFGRFGFPFLANSKLFLFKKRGSPF